MTPRHKVHKENLEFSLRLCDSAVKKYLTQRRKDAKKRWNNNDHHRDRLWCDWFTPIKIFVIFCEDFECLCQSILPQSQ